MSQKKQNFCNGFTIVELLITLAITGLLLSAIAVAFNASVKSHTQNQALIKAINASQIALSRITTQLRCAKAVEINSPQNECTLITPDNDIITYQYDSSDKKLYLINDSPDSPYVLCDNVTEMTFTRATGIDDLGQTYVKSVQISMTVVIGSTERKISAAAVIRRNLQH